jgi:hypothetical protein
MIHDAATISLQHIEPTRRQHDGHSLQNRLLYPSTCIKRPGCDDRRSYAGSLRRRLCFEWFISKCIEQHFIKLKLDFKFHINVQHQLGQLFAQRAELRSGAQ